MLVPGCLWSSTYAAVGNQRIHQHYSSNSPSKVARAISVASHGISLPLRNADKLPYQCWMPASEPGPNDGRVTGWRSASGSSDRPVVLPSRHHFDLLGPVCGREEWRPRPCMQTGGTAALRTDWMSALARSSGGAALGAAVRDTEAAAT